MRALGGHLLLLCASAFIVVSASPGCSAEDATIGEEDGGPHADAGGGGHTKDSGASGSKDASNAGHDTGGGNGGDASTGDDDDTGDDDTGDDDTGDDDTGDDDDDDDAAPPPAHDAGPPPATGCANPNLVWHKGEKTTFTSYPDPNSAECIQFSGCDYEGQFSACNGVKSKAWVKSHNIVAVFPKFSTLKLHDLCLRSGSHHIVATVLDECADSDCSGCCTRNAKPSGTLLDLESFTDERFGVDDQQIEWADLGPTTTGGCN